MALSPRTKKVLRKTIDLVQRGQKGDGFGPVPLPPLPHNVILLGKPTSDILPWTNGYAAPQVWGAGDDTVVDPDYPEDTEILVTNKSNEMLDADSWYIFILCGGAWVPIFTAYCPGGA